MTSPATQLRTIASHVLANLQHDMLKLQSELEEMRSRESEMEARLMAARAAEERFEDFAAASGLDYPCPYCWMRDGERIVIKSVATDAREDTFRCPHCAETIVIHKSAPS